MTDQATIAELLATLIDPAAETVESIVVSGGEVGVVLAIDPATKTAREPMRQACEQAIAGLPGIADVRVIFTAHRAAKKPPAKPAQWNTTPLVHVGRVIAVASGKGGVGKSTTTVNIALALAAQGKRVGILDADIYGPSIPRMLGLANLQPAIENGQMLPTKAHGLCAMSMGLITGDAAAIMRGPMITKALHQLLRSVRWGTETEPLDMLLIDMPPGTGDIHLSLAQAVPLSGAIIVTTPQDVAVIDAQKCLQTFVKLNVPILGVVENMSYFVDASGNPQALFGSGGGARLAALGNTDLLGQIPLDAAIGVCADTGEAYGGSAFAHYVKIAEKL